MKKGLFLALTLVSCVVFVVWSWIRISATLDFNNNCGGYLNRAANANSIELANENLTKAIEYLERNNLTEGQVSIVMRKPKNDISYWYKNLKSAQAQLQDAPQDITNLEESNILMKLRETLTDNNSSGTTLVCPDGITIYPNNISMMWISILSSLGFIIFGILTLYYWDE